MGCTNTKVHPAAVGADMEAWTVGKELGGKRWRALVGRIRVRGPVCGGSTKVVPIGFRPGHHALTDR